MKTGATRTLITPTRSHPPARPRCSACPQRIVRGVGGVAQAGLTVDRVVSGTVPASVSTRAAIAPLGRRHRRVVVRRRSGVRCGCGRGGSGSASQNGGYVSIGFRSRDKATLSRQHPDRQTERWLYQAVYSLQTVPHSKQFELDLTDLIGDAIPHLENLDHDYTVSSVTLSATFEKPLEE